MTCRLHSPACRVESIKPYVLCHVLSEVTEGLWHSLVYVVVIIGSNPFMGIALIHGLVRPTYSFA